jgi:hypothetical protein
MKSLLTLFAVISITACHSKKEAKIEYEATEKNFIIKEGETYNASFAFKNTGNAELKIKSVDVSCLCTNVRYNKAAIAPGQADSILVTFVPEARDKGNRVEKIIVETNTKPMLSSLTLNAVVK